MIYLFKKYKKALLCALFLLISLMAVTSPFAQTAASNWMRRAKFGVMVHYLSSLQNGTPPLNEGKKTSWDSCVNDFDVNLFASQLHEVNAGYVIFTLYQGNRFICTPNVQYEKLTGYARGQATSHRDLIMDLANALQKYNIKLVLYVTGDGTFRDDRANKAFKSPMLQYKQNGNKFTATNDWVNNWTAVLREWSMRYGKKVAGWWVDGAYQTHGYNDSLLSKFSYALKAGNSNSMVGFNNAVHPKIQYYSKWDTYTAGEMNDFKDLPPAGGNVNGKQWHIVSFLGTDWASSSVKYTPDYITSYVNQVNSLGGVVTMNVAVNRNGSIAPDQFSFLKGVSTQIKSR